MILKIIKNDFSKKKIIMFAVFIFIMLSAMLMSSGTNMIINLVNSLDYLFESSSAPHFTQSHSGQIDRNHINKWSEENKYVKDHQIGELLNISGSNIYINSDTAEKDSLIDNGFVKQNKNFDYLLNLDNEIIEVNQGEIAVPIHYQQRRDLNIGDNIVIGNEQLKISFIITDFVRDVQMNPSIISSKRFVVSNEDFNNLKKNFGEIEYLISFQLNDLNNLQKFGNQYSNANLPQRGPTIDYDILRITNSLTDGLIAAVVILISLLLCIISLLCLRFVILLTLEEDYREIGVMKAIGILPSKIKKIYLLKYVILAVSASIMGFLFSLFINNLFTENIMIYIGTAPLSFVELTLPFLASLIIAIIVIAFSFIVLRRFNKISAVEAIRMGSAGGSYANSSKLALYKNKVFNSNIFLGLRDVVLRFKTYIILFIVFVLATFIIIVPLNFLNTIQSPEFITYMGIGKSDIILDLRNTEQIQERFNDLKTYIENDPEVTKYAAYITSKYDIINQEGLPESMFVETGDFTVFPIDYLEGKAPQEKDEMALSYLSADELDKKVGDNLQLVVNGKQRKMILTGIYQDITNGGKTAKANISPNYETAAWYNINFNVNTSVDEKVWEYKDRFQNVKVTGIEEYIDQTVVNTIEQLELLTVTAITIAILISILITSLFLKMLVAKDISQIAIMKSIGISLKDIKNQYITKALIILNLGIIIGTVIANILGEKLLSGLLSIVGASQIDFIINPIEAYILTPVILMAIVTITTVLSINSIKEYSIEDINFE
ncbi:MAG TPA: ABC transporter permease [Halanaerobiales bacterium]|nr:ABC transporter permease [Halanaerobiales bacterium]